MLKGLLKKLIKASTGRIRFLMAIVGLSVALFLILAAVQIQANYYQLLNGKSNQDSIANFLVINKVVTNATLGNTALSNNEIEDLKKQPFTDAVGILEPSRYKVSAVGDDRLPFYTDLFFESVPDEFIDVSKENWQWDEHAQFVPVIIPNMFLDMYNFGFAASQNLPQLTQEVIKNIPLKITIAGAGSPVNYYAKVVGFSDRISSILVPEKFMQWANGNFATEKNAQPSRVVLRTKDPGNPQLTNYLKTHHLTTDADKTRFSKYRKAVTVAAGISWGVGIAMLLFALLIFTLFIELTIAFCKEEIALLVTLGAAPRQLKSFLIKQFFPSNITITLVVILLVCLAQWVFSGLLETQAMYVSPFISVYTLITAAIILLVLWIVNRMTIAKYIG
jgi:hypothetical protein